MLLLLLFLKNDNNYQCADLSSSTNTSSQYLIVMTSIKKRQFIEYIFKEYLTRNPNIVLCCNN